jgi:hypothetical protein
MCARVTSSSEEETLPRCAVSSGCFSVLECPDLVVVALATDRQDTRQRLAELIRQVENGQHDEKRNLWTALAAQLATAARHDHHSRYQ